MITNMNVAEWQNKANRISLGPRRFHILYCILMTENDLITDKNLFTISNASLSYNSMFHLQEPHTNDRYTQRVGPDVEVGVSPTNETFWALCPTWSRYKNSYLFSYAGPAYDTLKAAHQACFANDKCNGIA